MKVLLNGSSRRDAYTNVALNEDAYTSQKKSYKYKTQELYAEHDGKRIFGIVYIPQNSGKIMPAVIYSHGLGGSYEYGEQYATALARKAYVVYCFDFCGGSQNSRSDGSPIDMSIFTEQADLEAVISMMRGLYYVDRDNIFLLGSSQGGAVSAITAADHKELIQGIILLYPAFMLGDNTRALFSTIDDIPDTYYHMWMTVGRTYFENLLDYDIYEHIVNYDKDILIIHGDADNIVPLSYSEKAAEVYKSADFKVIPGAAHGFYGEDAEKAIDYIMKYLSINLN